jgi:hypothetical protein
MVAHICNPRAQEAKAGVLRDPVSKNKKMNAIKQGRKGAKEDKLLAPFYFK